MKKMIDENEQEKLKRRVLNKCIDFIYELSHRRAVYNFLSPMPSHLWMKNFCSYVYSNSFSMAVIDWYCLFKEKQDLSWKEVIPKEQQKNFEEQLIEFLNVDRKEWNIYEKKLIYSRNKVFAHHEAISEHNERGCSLITEAYIPDLELARKAVCFYYNYLFPVCVVSNGIKFPQNLDKF